MATHGTLLLLQAGIAVGVEGTAELYSLEGSGEPPPLPGALTGIRRSAFFVSCARCLFESIFWWPFA